MWTTQPRLCGQHPDTFRTAARTSGRTAGPAAHLQRVALVGADQQAGSGVLAQSEALLVVVQHHAAHVLLRVVAQSPRGQHVPHGQEAVGPQTQPLLLSAVPQQPRQPNAQLLVVARLDTTVGRRGWVATEEAGSGKYGRGAIKSKVPSHLTEF